MQTEVVWTCLPYISGLAKTILQGTVSGGRRQGRQRKRWEDNIREWTGLEFAKSQRAAENRENWRRLVANSSVVSQRPSRLRDRWDGDERGVHLWEGQRRTVRHSQVSSIRPVFLCTDSKEVKLQVTFSLHASISEKVRRIVRRTRFSCVDVQIREVVCVFSFNKLSIATLAEWPIFFTSVLLWQHVWVQRISKQESAQEVTSAEENSPTARSRDEPTNFRSQAGHYHWASSPPPAARTRTSAEKAAVWSILPTVKSLVV